MYVELEPVLRLPWNVWYQKRVELRRPKKFILTKSENNNFYFLFISIQTSFTIERRKTSVTVVYHFISVEKVVFDQWKLKTLHDFGCCLIFFFLLSSNKHFFSMFCFCRSPSMTTKDRQYLFCFCYHIPSLSTPKMKLHFNFPFLKKIYFLFISLSFADTTKRLESVQQVTENLSFVTARL